MPLYGYREMLDNRVATIVAAADSADKVPYPEWVQTGLIKTTPGNVIDYDFVEKAIIDLRNKFDIKEIGFDPWNAMQTAINLGEKEQRKGI